MERNVGRRDATARWVLGIGLLVLAAILNDRPFLALGAALMGLVLLGTAATHACPLYAALGLSTCPRLAVEAVLKTDVADPPAAG